MKSARGCTESPKAMAMAGERSKSNDVLGSGTNCRVCYNRVLVFINFSLSLLRFSVGAATANFGGTNIMATEMKRSPATIDRIEELLGAEARALLDHKSEAIPKSQ